MIFTLNTVTFMEFDKDTATQGQMSNLIRSGFLQKISSLKRSILLGLIDLYHSRTYGKTISPFSYRKKFMWCVTSNVININQ